jgi:hypothetical protein
MSKVIDTSDLGSLSDEDLQFLAARDNEEAASILDERGASLNLQKGTPLDQRANTGDANTAGETIEQLEARLARMKSEQAADAGDAGDDDEDDEGLGPDDYADATNDQLRSEIISRNEGRDEADKLSLDGKKADLIATLEADDAEED